MSYSEEEGYDDAVWEFVRPSASFLNRGVYAPPSTPRCVCPALLCGSLAAVDIAAVQVEGTYFLRKAGRAARYKLCSVDLNHRLALAEREVAQFLPGAPSSTVIV